MQQVVDYFRKMGRNIMTPSPVAYYESPTLWIELSYGTGIFDDDLFGVTVIRVNQGKEPTLDKKLSRLTFSKQAAEEYIMHIIEEEQ